MVNKLWKIILEFIVWTVWKERNRRVFQNETRNIEFIKGTIMQNIRETVLTRGKAE